MATYQGHHFHALGLEVPEPQHPFCDVHIKLRVLPLLLLTPEFQSVCSASRSSIRMGVQFLSSKKESRSSVKILEGELQTATILSFLLAWSFKMRAVTLSLSTTGNIGSVPCYSILRWQYLQKTCHNHWMQFFCSLSTLYNRELPWNKFPKLRQHLYGFLQDSLAVLPFFCRGHWHSK